MADFNLAALSRAAGIRIQKVLAAIEVTQALEDELYAILYPIVNAYRQQLGYIEDAWQIRTITSSTVETIIQNSFIPGRTLIARSEPKFEGWSKRVEAWQRRRWVGVVKGATRLDIEPILAQGDVRALVEAQTKTNVGLIKGLATDIETKINTDVWQAYKDGLDGRALGKQLRESYNFAPARARLIAYDQLGKYSGALDKVRHTQAGLSEYIWATVGDDRVRPLHRAVNGKRFEYGKPPATIGEEPGQPIRCRCKAKAVLFSTEEEAELQAAGLGGLAGVGSGI